MKDGERCNGYKILSQGRKGCCNEKGGKGISDIFDCCNSVLRYGGLGWKNENVATDIKRFVLQQSFRKWRAEKGERCNGCRKIL
jgi:hypothetical protein